MLSRKRMNKRSSMKRKRKRRKMIARERNVVKRCAKMLLQKSQTNQRKSKRKNKILRSCDKKSVRRSGKRKSFS